MTNLAIKKIDIYAIVLEFIRVYFAFLKHDEHFSGNC